MKSIKVGDDVRFLWAQMLYAGQCVRVNKKSITVAHGGSTRLVPFNRVVREDDLFTVVWQPTVGVEGRYYITTDEFPEENAPFNKWYQPFTYFIKLEED